MKYTAILLAVLSLSACSVLDKNSSNKANSKTGLAAASDTSKKKEAAKNTDIKPIKELVKKCKKIDGLFTLYQDTTNGSVFLSIKKEQIGKEFIYWSYAIDGVAALGNYRGAFRDNKIFKVNRYFNRIELEVQNTNFHLDPNSELAKVQANFINGLSASQVILGQNDDKTEFLIKADDVFLSENLQRIKPGSFGPMPSPVGAISSSKSKYISLKNYPANTDISVEYVFDNVSGAGLGGRDVADSRYISYKIQHTFIEMPKNTYKPRKDDPRIGYFLTQRDELTSTSHLPYSDYIHRWHLEKKDPSAAISEPVEPLVYWMENTTPKEFRPIIMKAGLEWNKAFEKAGFKNAVVIKEQPDTASWDAGDIRYNVMRWSTSPNPPFGGYGPSFVNPRTGQILGADIIFDWAFVSNRTKQNNILGSGLSKEEERKSTMETDLSAEHLGHNHCNFGAHFQHQMQLGANALNILGISEEGKKRYLEEALYYLVLHEMGHTLGLMHNMKASTMNSIAELKNFELTSKKGLTGSVMDYPCANLDANPALKVQHFTTTPGPYDIWAIEFGYSAAVKNEEEEAKRLGEIAARSGQPGLAFGNDADDMRSPGKAIDPKVMIDDMSSDAVNYAKDRIQLSILLMNKAWEKSVKPNESYQELVGNLNILNRELINTGRVLSRYIGGVYVNRNMPKQGVLPEPAFKPVPRDEQVGALKTIADYLFDAQTIAVPTKYIAYMQQQRRGFNFFSGTEDPKLLMRLESIWEEVISHIWHPVTVKRVHNTAFYGNGLGQKEILTTLTKAAFPSSFDDKSPAIIAQQNLQGMIIEASLAVVDKNNKSYSGLGTAEKAPFFGNLMEIKKILESGAYQRSGSKAHADYLLWKMESVLDAD